MPREGSRSSRSRSRSRDRERQSGRRRGRERDRSRDDHHRCGGRGEETRRRTTTTTRENASGSECSSSGSDERDGRKRKRRGRKRRAFSSKSPTRRRDGQEKRKKEEDEKKTTDVENTVKYGYQPRAPNANGKQSVPKHPQSIVAATHLSIDGGAGKNGGGGGGGGATSTTTNKTKDSTNNNAKIEDIEAYQKKKQRDARRWLLSQQISAYENLSVPNSDTAKKQRQVYVGNIPPEVDAETLNVFLSSTLSAAYPEALASGKYVNDSLIEEIRMSADRKYCFATVVDPEMATALFAINGVDLCGYTLMIARPSGWVDPKTMKEKADIAYEQMKIIQAEERAELGGNLPAHLAAANNVASAKKVEEGIVTIGRGLEERTIYVRLKHIATEEDVKDDEEYEDLKLDVAAECEKFCSNSSSSTVVLPRRGPFIGSAFAKFSDKESALKAKEGMHGRAFDGRIIEGTFASESEYEQALNNE